MADTTSLRRAVANYYQKELRRVLALVSRFYQANGKIEGMHTSFAHAIALVLLEPAAFENLIEIDRALSHVATETTGDHHDVRLSMSFFRQHQTQTIASLSALAQKAELNQWPVEVLRAEIKSVYRDMCNNRAGITATMMANRVLARYM